MSIREDVSKMKLVSPYVAALSVSKRNAALKKVAEAIEIKKDEIFAENEKDLAAAKENNVPDPVVKRLKFNEGKLQDVIKGILPLSPAWMIPESARKGELLGIHFDPKHVPDELDAWKGLTLGGNYVRVAQTIHVENAIASYKGPVLIVHGDADEAVPVRYGIEAARLYDNASLVLIPGDTHCYAVHLDMVTDAVKDWMTKQLSRA